MFVVVEQLTFVKQLAGKVEIDKVSTTRSSWVHNEHSIRRFAIAVFLWLSERSVVYSKFR